MKAVSIVKIGKHFTVKVGNKCVKSFYTYNDAETFKGKVESYQKGVYDNEVYHALCS